MGVIKPPWVDKEWFDKCPYNYCDHFGDEEFLISICKICRGTKQETIGGKQDNPSPQTGSADFHLEEGLMPDNAMDILEGSDVFTSAVNTLLYQLQRYGNAVQKILNVFWNIPESDKTELITRAQDVLSHSRYYAYVKIRRAYSSYLEEQVSDISDELHDPKTSALFAYVALERNSRAFFTLAREGIFSPLNETYLDMADISLELMDLIKTIFFPTIKLKYTDIGCEQYDACFDEKAKVKGLKNTKH